MKAAQSRSKLNMSKITLDKLREKIQEALNNAELEDFGDIGVSIGRMRYTGGGEIFPVSVDIEISRREENGELLSPRARDFRSQAFLYGLQAEDLGRTFTSNGKTFTITGLNRKAKKYPIIADDVDGNSYKFPASRVKSGLDN